MIVAMVLLCVSISCQVASGVTTSYHIGNSLTFDSQPPGIAALAASRGLEHQVGYHIRSASSMHEILTNPEEVNSVSSSFGIFTNALPNFQWDYVTLQPFSEPSGTMGLELESILSFIDLTRSNPANVDTTFYIYQAWPQIGSYQAKWDTATPDDLNHAFAQTRDYYEHLFNRVRSSTDANVLVIPVGEVLYELDRRMSLGEVPGYSSVSSLYRDALHLKEATGRFIAGVTSFATILTQYPNELEKPLEFYDYPNGFTPEQSEVILDTIRDVLDRHPYSGVVMPPPPTADFNGNDMVDGSDLAYWQNTFSKQPAFDTDQDGDVDGRDFLTWQRNYRPSLSPEILAKIDLNNDGTLNNEDIQQWQISYGVDDGGDLDGDGDTDGFDFLEWTRSFPEALGDSNGDYLVDGADLRDWQNSYAYNLFADADGDGSISGRDFLNWQREYGRIWNFPFASSSPINPLLTSTHSLAVPEPDMSSVFLAGLVSIVVLRDRLRSNCSLRIASIRYENYH